MEISNKEFERIYTTGYDTGHSLGYKSALTMANLSLSMITLEICSLLDDMEIDKDGEIEKKIKEIIQKYEDTNKKEINEIANKYKKENNNE